MSIQCSSCGREIFGRLPPWCPHCGVDLKTGLSTPSPAHQSSEDEYQAPALASEVAPPLRENIAAQPASLHDPAPVYPLGAPEQVYHPNFRMMWMLLLGGFAFTGLGVFLIFQLAIYVFGLVAGGLGLVAVLGGVVGIFQYYGLVFQLFPDALVKKRWGQSTILRWIDIKQVFKEIHPKYKNYRFVSRQGQEIEISREIINYQALGDMIEQCWLKLRLPEAWQELEQGHTVLFGPLRVSRSWLVIEGRPAPWSSVRMTVDLPKPDSNMYKRFDVYHLLVYVDDEYFEFEIEKIPNYSLFLELVKGTCPAAFPPQELSSLRQPKVAAPVSAPASQEREGVWQPKVATPVSAPASQEREGVWPVPEPYARQLLTFRNLLIGNLLAVPLLILLFATILGGFYLAFKLHEISPWGLPVGLLFTMAIALLGVWYFFKFCPLQDVYVYRLAKSVIGNRPDFLVDPQDPEALFVAITPRLEWTRQTLDTSDEAGFLRVDTTRGYILFEGDKQRYRIPGKDVVSCEVESQYEITQVLVIWSKITHYKVVLRARSNEAIWEVAFHIRRIHLEMLKDRRSEERANELCALVLSVQGRG